MQLAFDKSNESLRINANADQIIQHAAGEALSFSFYFESSTALLAPELGLDELECWDAVRLAGNVRFWRPQAPKAYISQN